MIIEMIINYNCDFHHLLIMAGAQSAENNHDYLDGDNIRYMIIIYWSTKVGKVIIEMALYNCRMMIIK